MEDCVKSRGVSKKKVCDEENIQIAQDMTALSSCVALLKVYCPRASILRCACVCFGFCAVCISFRNRGPVLHLPDGGTQIAFVLLW